ncbi:MarR family winged helix-turn-helix transcriptional regulator [Sediminicola luteus]|uniref:HTH marR-type domain-containing protein n=1 Tax=Sediminicola luteus TaxID=319238 RepID=A0A2A4G6H2_9FLAO|nr:MarR family transcriptional regulator [Sediminicola luteus]PCE64247.1 hypothetical protein B7P33_08060 [Sediminicola luteus]
MKEDYIKEIGVHALAARFKRISDQMIHSCRALYKEIGLDIEPNWYLVFKLLEENQSLTTVEIAERLGFSHPTVVNMIQKMSERDYVVRGVSESDTRKKPLHLTPKAKKQLPYFKEVWQAGEAGISELLPPQSRMLEELAHMEACLKEQDFRQRTLANLKT